MPQRIAIIAGAGRFPFHVAQEAKRQGWQVVGVGVQGWADPALAQQVDVFEEIPIGHLGRLLAYLQAQQVRQAIMAGKVTKEVLFGSHASLDDDMRGVLATVREASVHALLGAVANRLADAGITLLDSSTFLTESLCPLGPLTQREPTADEQQDIRVGQQAARALAAVDIGQTVIVKARVIVAVEALEGTDAAIRRARALAGSGCVIVKVASAMQDRRFDLPVIGPQTIATLVEAQASCVAMEAGSTLLLDRATLLAEADRARICLVGIQPDAA